MLFDVLARVAITRARWVLGLTVVAVLLAAFAGIHAFGELKSAGFVSPNAPSQVASDKLRRDYVGPANLIFVVQARTGTVDSPDVATAGVALTVRLAAETGVGRAQSYWTTHDPSMRSLTGAQALVLVTVEGDSSQVSKRVKALAPHYIGTRGPITVEAGGGAYVGNSVGTQITGDLAKAEAIAIPLTLLFLILAFGSVVSAALPVAIGAISIFTTLAVLWILGSITDVSQYALNLTTAMSLGLAIDYSLLLVYRFREELASGRETQAAVTAAIHRAGRTIVFSAATVAAAMAALLVFPVYFLRSFAYAGISVVVLATVGALVVLPAALVVLGPRVESWRIPVGRGRAGVPSSESAFWRRVAGGVMSRPLTAALPIVAVLVLCAVPFAHVSFGSPDDRVLAPGSSARAAGDALRTQFTTNASTTAEIVTSRPLTASQASLYSRTISALGGVARVTGPTGVWVAGRAVTLTPAERAAVQGREAQNSTWISAVTPDPLGREAQNLVRTIRALPVPGGGHSYVGGEAASLVDQKFDLSSRLPLAIALIGLTTFVLLWLFTGSVVLPLKALALNALTLLAVLGAMVWIFQYGHLAGVLGFTPLPMSTTMPLLLFCIAFGLSMDYEVFLMSRIKELHDSGASHQEAIVGGLARVGRLVSMAAGLMSITFFAFAISKVSFIQMFALGTGAAIVVDATVVRGVLVPAFMRLAGDWNWWSPPRLARLYARLGVVERTDPQPAAPERKPVAGVAGTQ